MTAPIPSRIDSVLVASDLKDGSEAAAASAGALASAFGAGVHGIYVEEVEYRGRPNTAATGDAHRRRSSDPARRLERWLDRACAGVDIASTWEMEGDAAAGIVDRARTIGSDLIVLGRHRTRLGDGLLGSTADKVARTSPVPVLLANRALVRPIRSITVPLDLSRASLDALAFAFAFASALRRASGREVEVDIVHVAPVLEGERGQGMERALLRRTLEAEVSELTSGAGPDGLRPAWSVTIEDGLPVDRRILEHMERKDADLVVMGTHGRGGWKRALLGSIASKVGRQASVPVILVPSSQESNRETDEP